MAVKFNGTSVRARAARAAMRGVVRATEALRNEAISLILDTPKTGRVYVRGGVEHQASAPGEPFASDKGVAVNSLITEYDVAKLTGTVVATDPKFPYLEFGAQHMEPRPVLRPAMANRRGDVEKFVREELAKEFGS